MLRRSRRPAALVAALLVLSGLLAACGSDEGPTGFETADRLDAVTIGEGETPTVEFNERMSATDLESTTLVEGDGAPVADGDVVFVNYLLGDGYTREVAIDSYGEDAAAVQVTVGGDPVEPTSFDDVVVGFLLEQITPGVTRGTRLAITGDVPAIFGEGLALSPALAAQNIGNKDPLLVIADVLDTEVAKGVDGEVLPRPAWSPVIDYQNGRPTGFDFTGVAEPDDKLLAAVLRQGTGDVVEKGDLIVANYLGQVYDGDEPFDESYTKEPIPTPIGLGSVVAGWDKKLVGQTVGSRVLLRIPPKDGYGKQAQGETIPANSTLYFVVDILATA